MKIYIAASVLILAACHGPVHPPDMRQADMSLTAQDLACIACDSVLNPCPAMGLECNPALRCCVSPVTVADLSAPACLPAGAPCDKLKPPACCDGIACGVTGHCLTYGDM